ncbi:MAG: LPS export ABC transporter periplasmic protein LptC [Geobacteraceae bacterium]|nr:LPS export ABC transporter periplasmic protein LptC [Geobacteraceae bacterium]
MVSPVFIRPLLVIIVTTAFIGIVAVIYRNGSHRQVAAKSAIQQLPQNIDVALNKARFSEIRDGSVVWELLAEHVEYDKNGEVAHLSGIRLDFARSGLGGTITVTAERGDYFSNTNDMQLSGKVHVIAGEGISFDTDSIEYNASKSRFRTTGRVMFRQQRLSLTATGMELDVKDQRAHFMKTVEATVAGASAVHKTVPAPAVVKAVRPAKKQPVKKAGKRGKGKKR